MKTLKDLLIELRACPEAREWAGDMTIEDVVQKCNRGDWLLWLAARVKISERQMILAKGHCANTVRHLMKDERSIKAVDAAIAYGEGRINREDLTIAAAYADAAAVAAADAVAARTKNQLQTADICRKYIGQDIIDRVNEMIKSE